MKTTTRQKCFAAACSAAALGGVWLATAIFHPSVSKAFTIIEKSAYVFPEVTIQPGENMMLCSNNLVGGGSTTMIIAVLDVADSTRLLAGTTPVTVTHNQQQGACSLLLPAVRTAAGTISTSSAMTGIPVMFVIAGPNAAGASTVAGPGQLSSVQVVQADGSVRAVVTPTFMNNVLLPAVQ